MSDSCATVWIDSSNSVAGLVSGFEVGLDPGYLGHRALLREPEEAADQLSGIIADEVRAILEDPDVTLPGRLEMVSSWIDDPPADMGVPADRGLLKMLHRYGNPYASRGDWEGGDKPGPKRIYTSEPALAKLHAPDLMPDDADERWSHRMSVSTSYLAEPPYLRLGTVLHQQTDGEGEYWLCLMPLCDSVRIEGTRAFPLLRLENVSEENGAFFNCIVRHGDQWKRLRVSTRIDQVKMIQFQADEGVVAPTDRDFTSIDHGTYMWIATLKPDVAHRFAQEFGERVARIGLDESEWLRLWARPR